MSTMIDTTFNVRQRLFGLRNELAKARQARKQTVADFLASIAQSIEDASALLKQGTYPHGKYQELLAHSQHMEAVIGDLVGEVARPSGGSLPTSVKHSWNEMKWTLVDGSAALC